MSSGTHSTRSACRTSSCNALVRGGIASVSPCVRRGARPEQVRLAIESLRALDPVLRDAGVDDAIVRDLEQARANLQLAYAAAVGGGRRRLAEAFPAACDT